MMSPPPDASQVISDAQVGLWEPPPPFDIGPERPVPDSLRVMREELRRLFPKDAKYADKSAKAYADDDSAWTVWFEAFAERTRKAFRRGDEATAVAHMTYMSDKLEKADADARYAIDVDYVENFLYKLSLKKKRWAWTLIPQNLKDLYVAFWGEITPRKMARIQLML